MNKSKISLIASIILVFGTTSWLIINRTNKKKILTKLMSDLETGEKSEDPTSVGVLTKSTGALNPSYWKTVTGAKILTTANINQYVPYLRGMIHGTAGTSDEEGIIKFFTAFKSKTQTSYLAEKYQAKYGVSLAEDLKYIDYAIWPVNKFQTSYDLPKIIAVLVALPDK
jgi:hypothetical protein